MPKIDDHREIIAALILLFESEARSM